MSFTVSDEETRKVIADFLEMGHVDNIIALFRQDPSCYRMAGEILDDERFRVRMGMVVLFESLRDLDPDHLPLAVDSLAALLTGPAADYVRGEAATALGLIGSEEALALVRQLADDPSPQLRELALDILGDERGRR